MKHLIDIPIRVQRIGEIFLIFVAILGMYGGGIRWQSDINFRLAAFAAIQEDTAEDVAQLCDDLTRERTDRKAADVRLEQNSAQEYAKLNLKITEFDNRLTTGQNWIIMFLKGDLKE